MPWQLEKSLRILLVSSLLLNAASRIEADDDGASDMLPSDVPMTMMKRIITVQNKKNDEVYQLETDLGTIDGLREPTLPPHNNNTHMHSFRGIPYAKAPTGNLRFTDPVDYVQAWPGKRLNATKFQSFCPQFDKEANGVLGDEDCLYLNVYTPDHLEDKDRATKHLLPVFVFIHGGAYIRGSSSSHGAGKLLSRDVVVVAMNYRLGALGFLSTADSNIAGNFGVLDQVSALRWVQRNIAQFGGDPTKVTIGGFSAGSASVHHHMMSPLSEGLFHRGIMMSGAGSCPYAVRRDPMNAARLLAKKLGCPTAASEVIANCIASKTTNQIVTAQAAIYMYEFFPVWFAPIIDLGLRDAPFLPGEPKDLVLRPTPTIVGSVPDEGLLFAAGVILFSEHPNNITDVYDRSVGIPFLPWPYPETQEEMQSMAQAFYFNRHARTSKGVFLTQVTEALTDAHFMSCLPDAADMIAKTGAPVYTYMMTHREPDTPTWAAFLYEKLRMLGYQAPVLDQGVSHGDDLIYLFNFPYIMNKGTERDHRVGQMILQMFTNFIVDGTPQRDLDRYGLRDIPKWEQITPDEPVGYYNIAVNPSMVHTQFKEKEHNFWNQVVPIPKSSKLAETWDLPEKPNKEILMEEQSHGSCATFIST